MISERELLEQLDGGKFEDLAFALMVYKGDLERLKRVLLYQVGEGLIQIWEKNGVGPLEVSKLKAIWCDDANFTDAKRAQKYQIHVTSAGWKWVYG